MNCSSNCTHQPCPTPYECAMKRPIAFDTLQDRMADPVTTPAIAYSWKAVAALWIVVAFFAALLAAAFV